MVLSILTHITTLYTRYLYLIGKLISEIGITISLGTFHTLSQNHALIWQYLYLLCHPCSGLPQNLVQHIHKLFYLLLVSVFHLCQFFPSNIFLIISMLWSAPSLYHLRNMHTDVKYRLVTNDTTHLSLIWCYLIYLF